MQFPTRLLNRIVVGALLATCLLNAAMSVRQYYHPLVSPPDDWVLLENDLAQSKDTFSKLSDRHVEYILKEGSDTHDTAAFYHLQTILAPAILCQDGVERPYVLVEFWTTKEVKPLPGLSLIKNLGHGLALYQRPIR